MIIVIIWSVLSFKFIDGLVLTVYCVKRYAYKTLKSASIKGSGLKAETLQNVEISFSLVCHWPRVYRVYTACKPRVSYYISWIHERVFQFKACWKVFFFAMCKDNFFPERMKLAGRNL